MANIKLPEAQPPFEGAQQRYIKQLVAALKDVDKETTALGSNTRQIAAVAAGAQATADYASNGVVRVEEAATTAPAAPSNVLVSSSAYWDTTGAPKSRLIVTWDQVEKYYNDQPLGATSPVTLYQVWSYPNDNTKAQLLGTIVPKIEAPSATPGVPTPLTPLSLTVEGLAPGTLLNISVRARTQQGSWSEYSAGVLHTTAQMTEVPNTPTAPVAGGSPGVVTLAWDGNLLVGAVPTLAPNTLSYVYAVFSTTSGGTYTAIGSSLSRIGSITIPGLVIGQTYWFKFGAVNKAGVSSLLSTAVSAVVQGVDLLDLDPTVQAAIDAALAAGSHAQTTADGKNTIYTSATTPTGGRELRRNLNTNPRMDNSTAGWTATGTGITQTAAAGGTRIDAASIVGTGSAFFFQSVGITTAPGEERSSSVEITVPAGYPAISLRLRTSAYGAEVDMAPNIAVTISPGQTVTLTAASTGAAPAGTTLVRTIINPGNAALPAGSRFFIRNAGVYNTRIPGPFFSGASAASGGNVYSWVGTPNASVSLERLALVAGDMWWKLGTGPTAGSIINVNMYTGSAWTPYMLVADEILVPGSAGSVVIRDGAISAPKILAEEAFFDKIFTSEFMAYRIKVDQVVPNFGDTLNLGGNAVAINLTSRADAADVLIEQTQQNVDDVQLDADAAAAAADAANQAVESLAAGRVLTAESALAVLSGKIDNYENSFLFLSDGLHIRESTEAIAEMVLTSAGARLVANGTVVSEWNQGQMIVDQIVANGGKIGNHILDASIPGQTVYRPIA